MARIRINFAAVAAADRDLERLIREMEELSRDLSRLRREMDPAIQARNGVGQSLRTAAGQAEAMEDRARRLHQLVERGVASYRTTERRLVKSAPDNKEV